MEKKEKTQSMIELIMQKRKNGKRLTLDEAIELGWSIRKKIHNGTKVTYYGYKANFTLNKKNLEALLDGITINEILQSEIFNNDK